MWKGLQMWIVITVETWYIQTQPLVPIAIQSRDIRGRENKENYLIKTPAKIQEK